MVQSFVTIDETELAQKLNEDPDGKVVIGSVNQNGAELSKDLGVSERCLVLDHETPLPIGVEYKTPSTLGIDRVAGVTGASALFPGNNCLVIDIGTCITYDYINKTGTYLGGAISPGLEMKLKALHDFTANLPSIPVSEPTSLIGDTTKDSILSGVFNGTLAEIEQMIKSFKKELKEELLVVVCGGQAQLFESKINGRIFVLPELVLVGLNEILQYNA